ncbi:MAG: FG-GAP-like repeat-containing protein, partial [Verrucomicrobiales bacterium]|nr:FG-GAP-like repeat-containing protein [Verrucomicrobiales bacterium]
MKVVFHLPLLAGFLTAAWVLVPGERALADAPIPSPVATRDGDTVVVTWQNISGVSLESSTTLGATAQWQSISEAPRLASGQWSVTFQPQASARFFRLRMGGPPQLEIHLGADGDVLMSWPQTAAAYTLEASDQLTPPLWRPFSQQPALQNNRYSLALTLEARTRFFRLRSVSSPAALSAVLSGDTGIRANDNLTSVAEVTGKISPLASVANLSAGFDDAPPASFVSIRSEVQSDGTFVLEQALLDQINGTPLRDGPHSLHLRASDSSGNVIGTFDLKFTLDTTPANFSVAPADGQREVLPRQLVVATFNEPVVIGVQTSNGFLAKVEGALSVRHLGAEVPGRLFLDETGLRLSIVPSADLPGSTEFQVSIDVSKIFDRAGNPTLAPTKGTSFRTVASQAIPGTSLMGWVFDSARAPQGGNLPVVGAKITVVNSAGVTAMTDGNGRFQLTNIPGGRLLLEVDGTVANALQGSFYPSVTKVFDSVPGAEILLDVPIYLPLVPNAAFVALSNDSSTAVANPTQLPGWTLEVPPNAVQRRDGTKAGRLLIAPVPPQRLPAPLPPGVDPNTVITIQAEGGADIFTQPVALTAPNLEGLPPGAKTVLWDFDHARGDFVPVATATVSADGKTVTTDPGQGVLRPGWHFIRKFFNDLIQVLTTENPKKKNKDAIERYKKLRLGLILDLAALAGDAAGLYPPAALIAAGASAGAGALRDVVVDGNGLNSASRDTVLLGIQAGGNTAGLNAAEASYRASRNVASREFAAAAQDLGLLSKTLKGTAGIFTFLGAIDDFNTLKKDLADAKQALKDPPGDLSDQILRAATDLENAVADLENDLVNGLAEYLNGLGDAFSMVALYEAGPPNAPPTAPDFARLRELSQSGQARFLNAARIFTGVPAKIGSTLNSASKLEPLLARETENRIFYAFAPASRLASAAGNAVTGSTFKEIRLSLQAGESGLLTAVEPINNLIGSRTISIPAVVSEGIVEFREPPLLLEASEAVDTNLNGLPDDLDAVLGHPTRAQVTALRNGLAPDESGLGILGIVGRLSQRQQITETVFVGNSYSDLVPGDGVLYGVGGTNALEIIDISRPSVPVKIGTFRSGFTAWGGVERGKRVAVSGFGLRIYDVTDPRNPRVSGEIDYTLAGFDRVRPALGANHVAVSKGKALLSFDLDTGQQVSSVSLAQLGTPVQMQLNGDILYVLTYEPLPNLQFSVTTVRFADDGELTLLGETRPFFWSTRGLASPYGLAVDDRAAFVGPWLISVDPFIPGFGTIDISNPLTPSVIATPSTNLVTGAALLATDNSGHLLATVSSTAQNKVLEVYDVRDLKRTDNRVFSLALEHVPYSPGFSAGLAVFATEADVIIARVVAPDTGTQPPAIADVLLPGGPTLVERRRFGVHANVTDDVQVARVDLILQDDNVVATDAAYPFDLDFLPPPSLPHGQAAILTVRATDTGGNRSERTVTLAYQAVAPHAASVTPRNGFTTKLPLHAASVTFDKPLDRSLVTTAAFELRGAGADKKFDTPDDARIPVAGFSFNAENTRIDLDFGDALPVDRYRLTFSAEQLKDLGGNALDGEYGGSFPSGNGSFGGDFSTGFEVQNVPEFPVDALQLRGFRTDARDYTDYTVQSRTTPMIVTDVSGDGRPDIVRAVFDPRGGTNDYHVAVVALQNDDGTFADPVTYETFNNPAHVLAGDVSGDGKVDLVAVHFDSTFREPPVATPLGLSVLLGNGDGTFQAVKPIDTGGRLLFTEGSALLGDFTGDGKADIAQLIPDFTQRDFSIGEITNRVASELLVYVSTGNGAFSSPISMPLNMSTNSFGMTYQWMAAADLNRDGRVDLIIPSSGFRTVGAVLLSNGDGTFTFRSEPLVSNVESSPVLADFNGDNEIDAVVGNQFLRGSGGGNFQVVNNEGLRSNGVDSFSFGARFAADLNGDGRPDFATAVRQSNFFSQTLGIFTNKADGTFGLMSTVGLNPNALSGAVGAADLNGDRRPDLLFEGGQGTELAYFAYALFSQADGTFETVPIANGIGKLGLNFLPFLVDLNGDDVPDPVSYFKNLNPEPAVATLPSQGGGFGTLTTNLVGVADPNFFIRAIGGGDFNTDGKMDIVVSKFDYLGSAGEASVYLMLGNGDGTLQKGQLVTGPNTLLAVADFTGDG